MLFFWKNQHSENDYTTQGSLQIKYNPYQITNGFFFPFTDLEENKLNLCENIKDCKYPKQSWERKMELEEISLPDLRLYHKATVIKTVWYWHKKTEI